MKNSIVVRDSNGVYRFYNRTKGGQGNMVELWESRNGSTSPKMAESKVTASQSTYLVARVPGTVDQLELIECMHP